MLSEWFAPPLVSPFHISGPVTGHCKKLSPGPDLRFLRHYKRLHYWPLVLENASAVTELLCVDEPRTANASAYTLSTVNDGMLMRNRFQGET